jgi:hypothetical protein
MKLTKTINEHAFTSGLSDSQVTKLAELAHEVVRKLDLTENKHRVHSFGWTS